MIMKRYTIDDAAKALGIGTETLGRWLTSAHLAASPERGSLVMSIHSFPPGSPGSCFETLDELQVVQAQRCVILKEGAKQLGRDPAALLPL